MAFRPAGQGNPHGLSRVRAVGSPFEVSNNASRVPQTLNYVDCYPMKEEQFGEEPLYAVTCREAFKSLGSYDLSTITLATGLNGGPIPNNGVSPPATLAGYLVAQVGQLLVVDDASTNVGGTILFCNVMLYNSSLAGTTNAYAVVSLQLTISGNSGTTITPQPTYIFFDQGPTIGAAAIANNSITGVNAAFIDPYYLIYSAPAALALTISANTANYNIYNAAVAAGMTTARSITVTINSGVTVGTLLTGSGFYAGTTITVVNNGTILGNGGAGGRGGGTNGNPGTGSPGTAAIIMNWPITLNNTGTIAGGGGGGSGGYAGSQPPSSTLAGAGGGGGQGYTGGAGGAGGLATGGGSGPAGTAGTSSGGGAGGAISAPTYPAAAGGVGYLNAGGTGYGQYGAPIIAPGSGGGGGGYAAAGGGTATYGSSSAPHLSPIQQAGAAAGKAVQCNGYSVFNIPNGTYTGSGAYGTIYGVIG